jgi:hypothetical protein
MGNGNNHEAGLIGQQAAATRSAAPVENTVINNYYGDNASSDDSSDRSDSADSLTSNDADIDTVVVK